MPAPPARVNRWAAPHPACATGALQTLGLFDQSLERSGLHDTALVHHDNAVRQAGGVGGEVVRARYCPGRWLRPPALVWLAWTWPHIGMGDSLATAVTQAA